MPASEGFLRGLLAALLLLAGAATAGAQEEDFFRGKTMSLIIPIGPGGAYDTYGRVVARHYARHLGGEPVIVPRNMPGAGGALATNYMANVAPHDGTVLTIITSSFVTDQILRNAQIRYDARQFGALGRLADTRSVLFFWHESEIKKTEELWTKTSAIANSTLNELPAARLLLMNSYLGTKMKLIPGYPSARDFVLASERREADGGVTTYVGLLQLFPSYVAEKKIRFLLQFGMTRDPALPDVPCIAEFLTDPEPRQIFSFITSNDEIGRSLFTTPEVPPARLAQMRGAFDAMLRDPEFRSEVQRLNLPLSPKSGAEMQQLIEDSFGISAQALAKLKEVTAH